MTNFMFMIIVVIVLAVIISLRNRLWKAASRKDEGQN